MNRNPFRRRPRVSLRDVLLEQLAVTVRGVELAQRTAADPSTAERGRDVMAGIEHEGDEARHNVVLAMSRAVVTPLDREDLFRASRSIDDVLDNTRDFVREMVLWDASAGCQGVVALRRVHRSLGRLGQALAADRAQISRTECLAARKEAGRVRRAYQDGLVEVFEGPLTMESLKMRELLRRLDVIGLRLTEAADALLDGLVKRTL